MLDLADTLMPPAAGGRPGAAHIQVLDQVALNYCPMIDRQRLVKATRLTITPVGRGVPPGAAALLEALEQAWPQDHARVVLDFRSPELLSDLLTTRPASRFLIEVPASFAEDPARHEALLAMHAHRTTMLLRDRPDQPLPASLLPCFQFAVVHLARDRRLQEPGPQGSGGHVRRIGVIQEGVSSVADMEASFQRGVQAVLGWPIDEVVAGAGRSRPSSDLTTIVELIRGVDAEEPIDRLDALLRRDPALAFQMLRYINSPAFGLSVEITSFRHAIMILGYQRLKRWLALLLATASKDPNMRPVMFASVRRGVLMEHLGQGANDEDMRNELFICGVFSMLDRIFQQPFERLLERIPVPERVLDALVHRRGPYRTYLDIVQAVEGERPGAVMEVADNALLSLAEVNRSVLRALAVATELEGGA